MEIITPSRIHISLIDLNAELGRVDGGIGFGVSHPGFRIHIQDSDRMELEAECESQIKQHILESMQILSTRFGGSARIKLSDWIPPHVGLGSGTQLRLGIGVGYAKLHGIQISVPQLASILGRGGTSGIGIGVFQYGGLILDLGHSRKLKSEFLPSRFSQAPPPPIAFRHPMPNWHVLLIIPELKGAHGISELEIFRKHCPIPSHHVEKLCRIVLMQLIPGAMERDFESFSQGLNSIQGLGFKSIEIGLQHPVVRELIQELSKQAGVGMSSFGPCVYALAPTRAGISELENSAREILERFRIPARIIKTYPNNSGAEFR